MGKPNSFPCYWVYRDAKREWRWSYYSRNGNIIADSGEGYVNKDDCLRGIEIMKASKDVEIVTDPDAVRKASLYV